jgi:hypothetical protein
MNRPARCAMLGYMPSREYRVVVEGELSDGAQIVLAGMTVTCEQGKAVLVGPVRDQAELQGLLQYLSSLGLTLLEATLLVEP